MAHGCGSEGVGVYCVTCVCRVVAKNFEEFGQKKKLKHQGDADVSSSNNSSSSSSSNWS